jgi:phenylpropionate dioxygenase-like ring-hydroxylating dioxygenase large terminal subunit
MTHYNNNEIKALIKPGKVHHSIYSDPDIFALEISQIFGRAWNYIGHESQVSETGSFITTTLANKPVIMIRHNDDTVRVLLNHCPHRGAEIVSGNCGQAKLLRCCYHGWAFRTDGTLLSIPGQEDYSKGNVCPGNPDYNMVSIRTENYRGFIFSTLQREGPDLKSFLGNVTRVLDNMVDRSPTGKLTVTGGCFRALHRNNWKIYLENLHDGVHPLFVHQSSVAASQKQIKALQDAGTNTVPFPLQIVQANNQSLDAMKELEVSCYEHGHSDMRGFRDPRDTDDEVVHHYIDEMEKQLGKDKADNILNLNLHNSCIYPGASAHPSFLQMRKIIPVAPDKTIIEAWVYRWDGVPDEVHRRNIIYANTVHSPASIIKIDDLEAYSRVQKGVAADTDGWLSQYRKLTDDAAKETSDSALSENFIRNQYRAWLNYMCSE